MGYIYKITNLVNNKKYIGQTVEKRPTDRLSKHRYLATHPEQERGNSYLHRAMAKYGVNNFDFIILEEIDNEKLNEREQYWIQKENTLIPQGYNMTLGGDGTLGFSRPQTEEEKIKRSLSAINFYESHPERKEEISLRTKTLWQDEDYRKKVTESNKKFYEEHPDMFKGENNPMYGKHHTEEALKKIRAKAEKEKKKIVQLDKDTLEEIQIFDGVRDAEQFLNVSHGWLSKAARQGKIAYGYRWKFL